MYELALWINSLDHEHILWVILPARKIALYLPHYPYGIEIGVRHPIEFDKQVSETILILSGLPWWYSISVIENVYLEVDPNFPMKLSNY